MTKTSIKVILPLLVVLLVVSTTSAFVKPEFSMPQRGLNSYNSACVYWNLPESLACPRPLPLNEMVHGIATWGDLIYATGTNGSLFCLVKDGRMIFAERVPEKPIGIPLIDSEQVYVMTYKGIMIAFDRDNGEEDWRIQLAEEGSSDITRYGNIAVTCSPNHIHCINITNGLRMWNTEVPGSQAPLSVAILSNRVVVNHLTGIMCINLVDGKVLWSHEVERRSEKMSYVSVPVIHFDRVFITDSDGILYCYGLYDGEVIWSKDIKGMPRATVTTDGGRIWIPIGDRVVCMNVVTGDTIWDEKVADWVLMTQLIKSGDRLYGAGKMDDIFVVSAIDGSVIDRLPFTTGTGQELCVGGDYLTAVNVGAKNYLYIYGPSIR